jgi:hypothetical protein
MIEWLAELETGQGNQGKMKNIGWEGKGVV